MKRKSNGTLLQIDFNVVNREENLEMKFERVYEETIKNAVKNILNFIFIK